QTNVSNRVGAIQIVVGVIMLLIGILFAFLGNRMFRLVMFASGFVYLGFGVLLICIRVHPPGDSAGRTVGYIIAGSVCGVIGGILFACVWWLGLAGVGSLGGIALATLILSLKDGSLIQSPIGRGFFVAGLAALAIVLIFVLEKYIVILSTSFFGSLATFVGIDCFAKTGFRFILFLVLTAHSDSLKYYDVNSKVYGMIGGAVAMTAVGCVIQFFIYQEPVGIREYNFRWLRRNQKGDNEEEKILTEPETHHGP
ncbi:hypothetical protein H4R35_007446, partial [Dimargaris xerosporica]